MYGAADDLDRIMKIKQVIFLLTRKWFVAVFSLIGIVSVYFLPRLTPSN